MLNSTNPDFLQVDLGSEKTITAIETLGFGENFVTKFKVRLSHDGKKFSLLQTGDTNVSSSIPCCQVLFHSSFMYLLS